MARIIDFRTGKDITNNFNNEEESTLIYDKQDLLNSQLLTLINAILFCMNIEDDTARQELLDVVNTAYNTLEEIIAEKNFLR